MTSAASRIFIKKHHFLWEFFQMQEEKTFYSLWWPIYVFNLVVHTKLPDKMLIDLKLVRLDGKMFGSWEGTPLHLFHVVWQGAKYFPIWSSYLVYN